jgi:hypothetical protein
MARVIALSMNWRVEGIPGENKTHTALIMPRIGPKLAKISY